MPNLAGARSPGRKHARLNWQYLPCVYDTEGIIKGGSVT